MEYESWFWGIGGADLDAEGLDPDSEGWAIAPHRVVLAPAVAVAGAYPAAPTQQRRTWGPVGGGGAWEEAPELRDLRRRSAQAEPAPSGGAAAGGMSLASLRRMRVALLAAIVLVVATAVALTQVLGPRTHPGFSTASSVVDPGADLALEQSAALKVQPVAAGPKPPGRLIIHSIGIDAQIIPVGVDKDGNMAVTNESYDVGWYEKGPAPGDPGDAVVDGHLDWFDTSQAVFYNLKNVNKGDDIEVQRLDGTTRHFKVTGIQNVAYNARVPGLFAQGGAPRLSLITCGGAWNKALNQYDTRVIVDATLVT